MYKISKDRYAIKKVFVGDYYSSKGQQAAFAVLRIPKGAWVVDHSSEPSWRKIRTSSAYVVAIYNKAGRKIKSAYTDYHGVGTNFHYHVGKKVKPSKAFDHSDNPCSSGIHCCVDRCGINKYCTSYGSYSKGLTRAISLACKLGDENLF